MKTLLTLILIPIILMSPYAFKLSRFHSDAKIEGLAKQEVMKIQSVDLRADLLIAFFIAVAFILAFLIFRFLFGSPLAKQMKTNPYCLLALAPTILFAITFFVFSPGEILAMFAGQFGRSASGIIFGIAFIYGIAAHFFSSLLVSKPNP